NGVYKSTDGGKTWRNVGLTGSAAIGRIVVNPGNPKEVWVAAAGSIYVSSPQRGIYHTTDGGRTWHLVLAPPNPTTGGIDIALAPTDPNRVYVVSGDTNGFDKGFFVSNDGGDTFQTAGHANNEPLYQWWFGRIWVDPGNEDHVFVADVSLRQSFDGGQTW